jgi:hypothetical protein
LTAPLDEEPMRANPYLRRSMRILGAARAPGAPIF